MGFGGVGEWLSFLAPPGKIWSASCSGKVFRLFASSVDLGILVPASWEQRTLTHRATTAYLGSMQTNDLVQRLIALPLPERVFVAQELWQSIGESSPSETADGRNEVDERKEAIQTALRRNAELTSGAVPGRTHEEVMEAARRALECG